MSSNEIITIIGFNLDSNSYLINGNVLVDTGTGTNKEYLFSKLRENGVEPENIELIVNTHCHFDHVGGNHLFPNAKIAIHRLDALSLRNGDSFLTASETFGVDNIQSKVDIELEEGDKIGNFEVIHTPGHTKGGICLWDGENLISGDTIFAGGGVGRTDIGGNWNDLKKSVSKLMKLDVLNIYPGHGPVVEGNGNQHLLLSYSMF
ncbi:MBL fold metallo-hydrolase [Methanobrevibacter oralis]|uniref:MBL fold metallo-hydrolase n=1 Tax=Methanobrevibacter oralis TaxID=66851 RepID=UPI001C730547|nr:MBL fold metallo-hydrolase [Methanobrevibacter oralis]